MPQRKHKPEEIIGKLREVEIVLVRAPGTSEAMTFFHCQSAYKDEGERSARTGATDM